MLYILESFKYFTILQEITIAKKVPESTVYVEIYETLRKIL